MGSAPGWLSTLWSLSVPDKDGEDLRKLREQRLGDRVIKRVNIFVANTFLGFMAQCAMSHSMKVFLSSLSILVNHWSIAAVFFHWFSFVWNNFLKDFLWSSAQILFSSILAGKAFCQLGLWLEKLNYFDKISRKVHIKSVILVKVSDERYIRDLHHIKKLSPQCQ